MRGKREYERWLREELPEAWSEWRGEDLEFTELPDGRVLLLGYLRARSRVSGVEVRAPFGQLGRFRDGLVVEQLGFLDHAGAREAAGIAAP